MHVSTSVRHRARRVPEPLIDLSRAHDEFQRKNGILANMRSLKQSAIIVVDMQIDFLSIGGFYDLKERWDRQQLPPPTIGQKLNAQRPPALFRLRKCIRPRNIVSRICHAIDVAKDKCKIVYVKAEYSTDNSVRPRAVERHPGYYPCRRDHWGADLINPVTDLAQLGVTVTKPHFDAFFQTGLLRLLKEWNIQDIFVAGVETDVCILRTAQTAALLGYKTTILKDCVASSDVPSARAALEIFEKAYGDVKLSSDVLGVPVKRHFVE